MPTNPPDSTQLALDRTWLAHERTLMAWVRTATSMISFGFTIYKFFQFETENNAKVSEGLLSPRIFSLIMVSVGLISLLLATLQHRKEVRELDTHIKAHKKSIAELVAYLVAVFGILVLISTLFRS